MLALERNDQPQHRGQQVADRKEALPSIGQDGAHERQGGTQAHARETGRKGVECAGFRHAQRP
jgi:hypothetical protein